VDEEIDMRPHLYVLCILVVVAVTLALQPDGALRAQGAAPPTIVLDGGTLIDGNGGTPVPNVQITFTGNTITRIGRKGDATPTGAQVVNTDGKFVLPGLIDALVNYLWYQGEIYLNNGITSYVGIGDMGEVGVVYAEGIRRGKIRAPRPIDWPVHFAGPANNLTGLESPFDAPHPLRSPEDAREWTRRVLALGGYGITFQNGGVTPETFQAAVDVAHAAGKPVGIRAGLNIDAKQAALMGADFIPRSNGVAATITTLPIAPAGGPGGPNELELWASVDETKVADLVRTLVQQRTALIPSFGQKAPGLPKNWSRFELQARRLFADPFLMAYYPSARAQTILWNYTNLPNLEPDVVQVRRRGYENALRFHRMVLEAGGRVLIGTDGGNFALPGLGLHHEMQIFAEELGALPMQVIQAATKWPAEALRVADRIGTVERGKLADLLIVNRDPLADIANLQDIAAVVADGRLLQDVRYHADYWSPFVGDGPITLPVVDDIGWAVNVRRNALAAAPPAAANPPGVAGGAADAGARGRRGGGAGAINDAQRQALLQPLPPGLGAPRPPQPTIETLDSGRQDYPDPDFSKSVVKEGSPTVTMRINGFNYFQRSQVYFNGVPVPTNVLNRTQIEATIDESLLRSPGRYPIVVRNLTLADPANPALGNGTSNRGWLVVGYR
jgi:hypothetical protein